MKQLESKIFVSEYVLNHEYDYMFGDKKDEVVNFTFINIVSGKDNTKFGVMNYRQALSLARSRSRDGRYKSYEYLIE